MCGFCPQAARNVSNTHRWSPAEVAGGRRTECWWESWKEHKAKTLLTAHTRPQRRMCKQTAECTHMPGHKQTRLQAQRRYADTHMSMYKMHTEATVWPPRLQWLRTGCHRAVVESSRASEGADLFAAPPTFCGSPVHLSYISRECLLSQNAHNPLLAHSKNTPYCWCSGLHGLWRIDTRDTRNTSTNRNSIIPPGCNPPHTQCF